MDKRPEINRLTSTSYGVQKHPNGNFISVDDTLSMLDYFTEDDTDMEMLQDEIRYYIKYLEH